MKKVGLLIAFLHLAFACQPPVDPDKASVIDGLYQLTEYDTPTQKDTIPNGALSARRIDNQHLRIIVKGTSGKIRLNYSLASVLVTDIDRTTYRLTLNGKWVGEAGQDAISHYVILTPVSGVTLSAGEF